MRIRKRRNHEFPSFCTFHVVQVDKALPGKKRKNEKKLHKKYCIPCRFICKFILKWNIDRSNPEKTDGWLQVVDYAECISVFDVPCPEKRRGVRNDI